jgi:hypothetical protein
METTVSDCPHLRRYGEIFCLGYSNYYGMTLKYLHLKLDRTMAVNHQNRYYQDRQCLYDVLVWHPRY